MGSTAIRVIHTRVFRAEGNGGNPCPVIPHASGLSDDQRIGIARRFSVEAVFLEEPSIPGAHIKLRYFVPDHEMGVSGHASIAGITVAVSMAILRRRQLSIQTLNGCLEARWDVVGNSVIVTLEQRGAQFMQRVPVNDAARVLRLERSDIVDATSPVQVVSTSRPKILVPLRNREVLNRCVPDFPALWAHCEAHNASGLYAFTRLAYCPHVEARQFPLRAGFPEDAATGVAATALGAYLVHYDRRLKAGIHHFSIAQGYAMGAPSRINVVVRCKKGTIARTSVRGIADIVGEEEISI